ncbi:MAG: hypothetical protein J6X36_03970 [Lachnospiraceae bacterium]|nr:hypothetical protein [Lachnospiraceae bacterium]
MKRKSIAIILGIAFMLTIFAGCGTVEGTTTPAMPRAEETVAQVVAYEEQAVVEEAPQKEIQVTTVAKEEKKETVKAEDPAPQLVAEYPIDSTFWRKRSGNMFFDNRAWVEYADGSNKYMALIDEKGTVLCSVPVNEKALYEYQNRIDFGNPRVGECEDGIFYFGYGCLTIIADRDGKILYKKGPEDFTDNEVIALLGAGDGKYLMFRSVKSFSENKDVVYLMDAQGNILSDEIENALDQEYYYLGEGILLSEDDNNLFNLNNNNYINTFGVSSFYGVSDFYDGYCLTYGGMVIPRDAFDSQESFENFKSSDHTFIKNYDYLKYHPGSYGEGLYYAYNADHRGYFDISGNLVVELNIPDAVEVRDAGPFKDGYAFIKFTGADGNWYVGLIDRNGNLQYEPYFLISASPCELETSNGYVMITDQVNTDHGAFYPNLVTPQGKMLSFGDDWSMLGKDTHLECFYFKINDGFIYFINAQYQDQTYFMSLDGKTKIEKVKAYK